MTPIRLLIKKLLTKLLVYSIKTTHHSSTIVLNKKIILSIVKIKEDVGMSKGDLAIIGTDEVPCGNYAKLSEFEITYRVAKTAIAPYTSTLRKQCLIKLSKNQNFKRRNL